MPDNNIKVSVVIPTYKVEQYIERCARSLFEQTLDSIEYIFVDDCSPDNSIAVMQKVLEEYPHRKDQVKIIRHEVNQGVGAARNNGVAACSGDYIIHCDPDDWVDLNMYETMYNKAVECSADMVYCDYYEGYLHNNMPKSKTGTCNPELLIDDVLFRNENRSLCDKLFKQEIALSFTINCPDHIIMGEDLLRVVQMLKLCESIAYVPENFYFYRMNPSSITKSHWKKSVLQSLLVIGTLLPAILENGKHGAAINFFQCSNLLCMIKHPEVTSTKEFYSYSSDIGIKNIKDAMQFMEQQRKIILTVALKNYDLACLMCRFILFINSLLRKIKK